MDTLRIINDTTDPEFPDGIEPSGAELINVDVPTEINVDVPTEWVTWTGTYYPTLESVPWQARGSAVEVPARS